MDQRIKSVVDWANYVKDNDGEWKKIHTEFINSQFQKVEDFIERLSKTEEGVNKIAKLYKIKNKKGYSRLLKSQIESIDNFMETKFKNS